MDIFQHLAVSRIFFSISVRRLFRATSRVNSASSEQHSHFFLFFHNFQHLVVPPQLLATIIRARRVVVLSGRIGGTYFVRGDSEAFFGQRADLFSSRGNAPGRPPRNDTMRFFFFPTLGRFCVRVAGPGHLRATCRLVLLAREGARAASSERHYAIFSRLQHLRAFRVNASNLGTPGRTKRKGEGRIEATRG